MTQPPQTAAARPSPGPTAGQGVTTPIVTPVTLQDARSFVGELHRHNEAPQGGLFAAGLAVNGDLVGVAIFGRPVARALQDGRTGEITRNCTDGTRNACSQLYAACLKASKALGYRRVYTYTLQSESGASLRAAGFVVDAVLDPRPTWSCEARHRVQVDLFGNERRPAGAKVRWVWPASARRSKGGAQ